MFRLVRLTLGLLGAAAVMAACGGSSAKPAASGSTTTLAGRSQFVSCLESHGVPASVATSRFGFGGGGRRANSSSTTSTATTVPGASRPTLPAAYRQAFTACAQDLPRGAFGGGLNSPQAAAYRACISAHLQGTGVTLPSPPTRGSSSASTPPANPGGFAALRNNPAYQHAAAACAVLRPGANSSSTTSSAG